MHWKFKAVVQNALGMLPHSTSQAAYYRVQRKFGGLKKINPTSRLQAAVKTWELITTSGADPIGKTFFEVGTGRMLSVPLAYWLMGANQTVTFDLNKYLKPELVLDSLQYIEKHKESIELLFGDRLYEDRLSKLISLTRNSDFQIDRLLETTNIKYHAPGDAAETGLPDSSIDYHTSFTVLEHIPPRVLSKIFSEAKRILKSDGLIVHGIDYSDHFAHTDSNISQVNFLRFSQQTWDRWSGNRYMYMNRLRHVDYLQMIDDSGYEVLHHETTIDERSLTLLSKGKLPLDNTFTQLSEEELATIFGWIVAS